MKIITLDKENVLGFILESLQGYKLGNVIVDGFRYHHNASYKDVPSICRNGILSIQEQNRRGLRCDTDENLHILNDSDSHVNGTDGISLSVVGLTDLYPDEDEYNPFSPCYADLLISDDIRASRHTVHYGNEYIANGYITPDKLKSVDIRLEKLTQSKDCSDQFIEEVIEKYNQLRKIASSMRDGNLDIPLREMSADQMAFLDLERIIESPVIKLKK